MSPLKKRKKLTREALDSVPIAKGWARVPTQSGADNNIDIDNAIVDEARHLKFNMAFLWSLFIYYIEPPECRIYDEEVYLTEDQPAHDFYFPETGFLYKGPARDTRVWLEKTVASSLLRDAFIQVKGPCCCSVCKLA